MTDAETARRIALSLPAVEDTSGPGFVSFRVRGKQFAWTYRERVDPKKPRVPVITALAVRTTPEEKLIKLGADPEKFFTDEHYHGFPAVIVRLASVDERELRELLVDAWRCQAPRSLQGQLAEDD